MHKQKRPPAYMWAICLYVCLYLLAGCDTQTPSLPATPSPSAQVGTSAAAQVTADILFNLVGMYAGNYQWQGSSSSSPLRLEITQQETVKLSGVCALGDQRSPLLKAYTSIAFGGEKGGITFTVDIPSSRLRPIFKHLASEEYLHLTTILTPITIIPCKFRDFLMVRDIR